MWGVGRGEEESVGEVGCGQVGGRWKMWVEVWMCGKGVGEDCRCVGEGREVGLWGSVEKGVGEGL